jgi:hypothetical protein
MRGEERDVRYLHFLVLLCDLFCRIRVAVGIVICDCQAGDYVCISDSAADSSCNFRNFRTENICLIMQYYRQYQKFK